jgi:hypothetical protein
MVGQVVNLRAGRRPALSLRRVPIGAQDGILPHRPGRKLAELRLMVPKGAFDVATW